MSEAASTDGASVPTQKAAPARPFSRNFRYFWSAFFVILLIAFVGSLEPGTPPRQAWNAIKAQRAYGIALAMARYAGDHQGKYPSGNSSTEIFQKLLQGDNWGYLGNPPSMLYFPMKGKTPAIDGQPLKPENVCFDVTRPVDGSAPDDLPLVFSTGFKVSYEPGASAKRLAPLEFRWPGFELFRADPGPVNNCIVVAYKQPIVRTLFVVHDATNPNGSVPNFIPVDFNANGKAYRQLTPDGVMPDK